jgi:hypothetical protein
MIIIRGLFLQLLYLFHWDLETFHLKFSYSLRFTTYTDKGNESDKKFTVLHKESLIGIKYCNEVA